jgi:hypothetical protein
LELPQMDAAVHHFLASLPPPALDPKLLSHATENHLRIFQGRLINTQLILDTALWRKSPRFNEGC